ncbi:MAG: hypothetical protein H0X45_02360 [Planctomycetes bacterium]|nr:hypothetical protein [Planctomycetota bacterium]
MVQPSPFDRLIQDATQLANRDPVAAFARLDELFGKSLTESDVLALGAFAVHLGTAALGRFAETAAFQKRLLTHPTVTEGSATARSLWRGLAVVQRCAGDQAGADEAVAKGVSNDSERCRLAIMGAQTLSARAKHGEAIKELQRATELVAKLPVSDEIVGQTAAIATNLARLAESQLRASRDLLVAAAEAGVAAWSRTPDWRARHKALYHQGNAYLMAADPTRALNVVQAMMELEDAHDAGPAERFHTAALACRCQTVRGQLKIASGALEACRDFAKRVIGDGAKPVQASLEGLERFVEQGRRAAKG